MKGQLRHKKKNTQKSDDNQNFQKIFKLILEPYIDYNISEGLFTTASDILSNLNSYFGSFKRDMKKNFRTQPLNDYIKEYNLNKNDGHYLHLNNLHVAKYLKPDKSSQFRDDELKKLMSTLAQFANEIVKLPQEKYSIEKKVVKPIPGTNEAINEVIIQTVDDLSKDEYEKIKKDNYLIEKKFGKNFARPDLERGGYYDFDDVYHPDAIVKQTFIPAKEVVKQEAEIDWNAVSSDEEEVQTSVKKPSVVQEIKNPKDEQKDKLYNMLSQDNDFQTYKEYFDNIIEIILKRPDLDEILKNFDLFKDLVHEILKDIDKNLNKQMENESKSPNTNQQSDNKIQFLGEIVRDRVITQPNKRPNKSLYSETFQNYIKERKIEIPAQLNEESKMLLDYFGNRALVQPLGDSNLVQIRAEYEFPNPLFYHYKIPSVGSVVHTPLLWAEYVKNTKLNASPQEKLFRFMDDEDGLIILAKTQLSSTLVTQLLEKGNRTTFLGTVFYIINNPDKLVVNSDFKSIELVMKDINTNNIYKIEQYNGTLLNMNNDLFKVIVQNIKAKNNPLLAMYNKIMELPIFSKKYNKQHITKILSDPFINRAYTVDLLSDDEASIIPYIDRVGDDDLILTINKEFVKQSSYNYVRPSTLADIVKVFPKEALENVNTGLLSDLFQTFNYSNEQYLKKFKNDIERCLNDHINGNYSPETAILRHLQVYLESATNQYNRMNPSDDIYKRIFDLYPQSPIIDIENSLIYQTGKNTRNPDIESLKYTFNHRDILMRLVMNEDFLDEYLDTFYYPVRENSEPINSDILAHTDNYVNIENNSYRLVSINKQSKGLVVNKVKRADTWISELILANKYFTERLNMTKSPGAYSFAKIKNEVQEIGKLPRNFQTLLAYTQTHAQMISIMSKAHLKRIDKGGHSLIGFPLMGSLFDELLKIINDMTIGDTYMFNFSDNLYIIQRTEDGNIVYMSLDLVKGESSTYLGTTELIYRKWEKQFGPRLSDNFKAYLKLFLLDQTTMKTLMPASERDIYSTPTRYLVSGSVITTDCNHENTNLAIFLTQKLEINPFIKTDTWGLNPQFIELCSAIGMRFEIAHMDVDFLKTFYTPTEMMFKSKTIKMDMLGYNAVKLYDRYVPILEYDRFIKQVCFNKSGETEGVDQFYDYMRYRAIVMSGYLYRCTTLIYNFLLGKMHLFNKNNLSGNPSEIVEKISSFYNAILDIVDLGDQFFESVSKPYLESMKFLLPPGIIDIVKIVSSKNFGISLESKIIDEYRNMSTEISPIEALTILGDRVYQPSYNDLYLTISRDLNLLLTKQYNGLMKEIKSKIVGPEVEFRPRPAIKISVANLEADLVFLKTTTLRIQVFKGSLDFSTMKWLFLNQPLDKEEFKNSKMVTLLFSVFRIMYLMVILRTKEQSDVIPTYQRMLLLILKHYNIKNLPEITYLNAFPFLRINFKGIVKNNPLSTIKTLMDMFSSTYSSLEVQNELTKIINAARDILKKNVSKPIEIDIYHTLSEHRLVHSSPEFLTIAFVLYGMTELGPYMSLLPRYISTYKLLSSTRMIYNRAQIMEVPKLPNQNNSGLTDFHILLSFSLPYEINSLLSKATNINTMKINTIPNIIESFKTHPTFVKNNLTKMDDVIAVMRATLFTITGIPYNGPIDEVSFSFDSLEAVDVQTNLPDNFNIPINNSIHPSYHNLVKTVIYSTIYGGSNDLMDLFEREWTDQAIINRFRLFAVYGHLSPRVSDRLISYYIAQNYEFFHATNVLSKIQDINPLYKNKRGLLFNPIWVNSFFTLCAGGFSSVLSIGRQPIYNIFVNDQDVIAYNKDNNIGLNIIAYNDPTLETLKSKYISGLRNTMISSKGITDARFVKVKTAKFRDLRTDTKNKDLMSNKTRNIERVFHQVTDSSVDRVEAMILENKNKRKLRDPIFSTVPHRFIKYDNKNQVHYDIRVNDQDGKYMEQRIHEAKKFKKLNAQNSDKPKINFIHHEHLCKLCKRLYKHVHNKGIPDHSQFDYQCPWEDCPMYYMLGDVEQQRNSTKSTKILELKAMNSPATENENKIILKSKVNPNTDIDIKIIDDFYSNRLFNMQFKPNDIHTMLDHIISFNTKSTKINTKISIYRNKNMQKLRIILYDRKLKNTLFQWNIYYEPECPLIITNDRIKIPTKYSYFCLMHVYFDHKDVYLNVFPGIEHDDDNSNINLIYEDFTELEVYDSLEDARNLLEVRDTIGDLTFIEELKLEELDLIEVNKQYSPSIFLAKDIFGSILP